MFCDVSLLIAGSIATDHLMSFQGKFADSLAVEQLDKLSLSFLVADLEIRRGGVAANMSFGLGRLYLGRVLQAKGELDSAIGQYGQLSGPMQQWVPTVAGLGSLYAIEGRRADALSILHQLDSLSRTEYVTSYAVAVVHVALGQPDSAFAWLDRAVKERSHWLVWLNRDPRWEPVRSDPRYAALVRRVGIPP